MSNESIPDYFLKGSKHQKPVFREKNGMLYDFIIKEECKNKSIRYRCSKHQSKKCQAKVLKSADGIYIKSNEHVCNGSTESEIQLILQIEELKNKVSILILFILFNN